VLGPRRVSAPAAVDEAWGNVGALLADTSQDPSVGGRVLARATRARTIDGTVALGPNRAALAERESAGGPRERAAVGEREPSGEPRERAAVAEREPSSDPRERPLETSDGGREQEQQAVVLVSGCLGLIYLPLAAERLTLEQIVATHPRLLDTLSEHPGIGFVMVRSEQQGPLVIGARGRRRLRDDAVEGEDPLARFDATAAEHLRRHDRFPHCPDILVNGAYDPQSEEVAPFEEFMGSHGGLGGPQTHPFVVIPAEWSDPAQPIIGVQAMHEALRGWLAQPRPPSPPSARVGGRPSRRAVPDRGHR
jgi:hypothetical protein